VPPQEETTFPALFARNCAGCHGAHGKFGPAPPLNDGLFLALVPDAELERVISDGRAGTLMPAFAAAKGGHLLPGQVKVLASGLKSHWRSKEPPPSDAPAYFVSHGHSASTKSASEKDGIKVFARACASCHGAHGEGGKDAGALNDPDFLALLSDQALRRYVITGRPDLGMPDYSDLTGRPASFTPLTAQDVTNVTALLAHWRDRSSGKDMGD
jgi:cytochrome c oxidase cbb3-type subunit III